MLIYESDSDVRLAKEALETLGQKTALAGRIVSTEQRINPEYVADAVIELTIDSHSWKYIAECKSKVDRKSLVLQVREKLSKIPETTVLITPYISREIAEYCREVGLQFIDTCGNAYLNAPGLYVYLSGEKGEADHYGARSVKGLTSTATLRVAFALLCNPAIAQAPYRTITESAGVSLGAISGTFDDLKKRGMLMNSDHPRGRRLLEPKRLFDEWVTNYPFALRQKLNPRRFSAPNPNWWQGEELHKHGAVWSGEVAAERLTQYLKPAAQTMYVEPSAMNDCLKHLISTHRLRPDPRGQIEILEKFWNFPPDGEPDIAPAILVYADLIATLDPRNAETAQLIRETLIEPAFHQA